MTARIGILCTDGSILLLPEGTDIDEAKKEAEEHDWGAPGPRTRVVKFNIEIIEILCAFPLVFSLFTS